MATRGPYMRHNVDYRSMELHWINYSGGWIAEGKKGHYTVLKPPRGAWVITFHGYEGETRILGRRLVNWQAFRMAQRFEDR